MNIERGSQLADAKETGRIEAFSDGVFAIAITLLVLDIKVPPISDLVTGYVARACASEAVAGIHGLPDQSRHGT